MARNHAPGSEYGHQPRNVPSPDVAEQLVYALCLEDGGRKPVPDLFRSLSANLQRQFRTVQGFTAFLTQNNDLFSFKQQQGTFIVQPQTCLDLCKAYASKAGCRDSEGCGGLHICKFYLVSGRCKFQDGKCSFGHNLRTQHNWTLLLQHRLSTLQVPHLRKVFVMSRSNLKNTAPTPCKFYNVGAKGCTRGPKCSHLHICRHFLKNSCSFNLRCKRSHDVMEAHNLNIIGKHGIDTRQTPKDILTGLQAMMADDDNGDDVSSTASGYSDRGHGQFPGGPLSASPGALNLQAMPKFPSQNNLLKMRQLSVSSVAVDDDETEICMFYLRGKCGFGKSCRMHHKDNPYQWQIFDDGEWIDMEDTDQAEINFCDVTKDECFVLLSIDGGTQARKVPAKIDFSKDNNMTMSISKTSRKMKVRRLTTASSVQKPESFSYVTKWNWYWFDENMKWMQYGDETDKKVKSNATVEDIENAYLASTGVFQFDTTENQKYDLDFARMVQKNISYRTEKKVRRRPQFIDWNVEAKKKPASKSNGATATAAGNRKPMAMGDTKKQMASPKKDQTLMASYIPNEWDLYGSGDWAGVQYVKLDKAGKTGQEYKKVEDKFKATLSSSKVTLIKRIQSPEVFDAYERKKNWMKKNSKNEPKELKLFHGTKTATINAICAQGFDCRISGSRTGAAYGRGTYFGVDANISARYAEGKSMFLCKVLVGDPCQGLPNYVRPPPKDPQKPNENFYDSCVDNPNKPRMYIIFKPEQAYPEYIVEYE